MSLEQLSEENKKKTFEILSKVTEGIKKLPKNELPTEPDQFSTVMHRFLSQEDVQYLLEIGHSLTFSERNNVMKKVLQDTGRYIIREYDCVVDGIPEETFSLYIAEQA